MKYNELPESSKKLAFALTKLRVLAELMPEDYWTEPSDSPDEVSKYLSTREIILRDPTYTLDLIDTYDFDEDGIMQGLDIDN